jgi:hypothetical protein
MKLRILAALTLPIGMTACMDTTDGDGGYREDLNEVVIVDPADCVDPRDAPSNAAVVNDGNDDRLGIQWAIDTAKSSGRPVCLAPGRFDVAVNPGVGAQNLESLRIWNTTGLTMVGAGNKTVVAFKGSGLRPGFFAPGDWYLIGIRGAHDTYLGHFKIDGSARFDTEEQTHAIEIQHLAANFDGNANPIGSSGTRIDHVDFYDPQPAIPVGSVACNTAPAGTMCARPNHGGTSILCSSVPPTGRCSVSGGAWTLLGYYGGGDCVRMFAEQNLGVRVSDTTIDGSRAICDRSFVALQRGTDGYRIVNSTVDAVGDAAIDEEPTADGAAYRAYIAGNTFRRGDGTKSGILVAMSGTDGSALQSQDNVITGNVIDGSVWGYNTANTVISFNTITIDSGIDSPIALTKYGAGNRILGNTIVRESTASAGSGINANLHNSGYPSDIIIANNVIRLRADGNAIVTEPGVGVLVTGNIIESTAPSQSTYSGLFAGGNVSLSTAVERVTFTGNQVRGSFRRMVHIGQATGLTNHSVVVTSNIYEPVTTGTTIYGVNFDNGCPTPAPIIDSNIFRGLPTGQHVVGFCGTGWIGTNSGP